MAGGRGRSLEKGTGADYDVIVTLEFSLTGYFLQKFAASDHCCISWQEKNECKKKM